MSSDDEFPLTPTGGNTTQETFLRKWKRIQPLMSRLTSRDLSLTPPACSVRVGPLSAGTREPREPGWRIRKAAVLGVLLK